MSKQIHTRFTDEQVKFLLDLYLKKALSLDQALQQLQCSKSRFFQLLKKYRTAPETFTITYPKRNAHHRLALEIDNIIREELEETRLLIQDPNIPVFNYNYAYTRDQVVKRIKQNISAQTVRNRAQKWGYYIPKANQPNKIPREVVTEAVGILLQHDASYHKWSPFAEATWTLITTIEDYSRLLLYAELVETETTWAHIQAVQAVILSYGVGLLYYVDSHSIFRLVRHRRSIWQYQRVGTDEALTQWRKVVERCGMQVIYALSPAAKGKVERPFRWLQDRLVRQCARERVVKIEQCRPILAEEVKRYNEHQVHSTTGVIPRIRYERALKEGWCCFKPFSLPPPYTSIKDVFCLHALRKVNSYNQINWLGEKITLPHALKPGTEVELHIIPKNEQTEVRFWHKDKLLKVIYYKS